MLMFFISLILVMAVGFFVSAIFEQKNFIKIFIYFCISMFAVIVLNVELLSLFSGITANNILILNLISALAAGYIWNFRGRPLYKIRSSRFFKRLCLTLLSDKYLIILGLGFLFLCAVSLFLISIMPVINWDAWSYHVTRSLFWIGNGSLNHFEIPDIRNLTMPINSEILYLWLLIFMKKQLWLGIFSFIGFLLSIVSLYGIIGKIGFSERHKLWVIFLLSSMPAVIIQMSGTETDIIIAGLVLSSMYLYWDYFKTSKISNLYFAALSYALAIGTKTPSLMLMFPVGIWMLWLGFIYRKKYFYKPFIKFLGFGVVNFALFASYNYILNLIDYGNLFGPYEPFLIIHRNMYGIRGACAGFIKHIFLFFDTTGFHMEAFGKYIYSVKENILSALSLEMIPDGILNPEQVNTLNATLLEPKTGLGILGFLVFFPCWIIALVKPLFTKNKKTYMLCSFALILLGAIIVMSYEITFMVYSIRFLASFCVVSSPILIYSYRKNNSIYKFLITIFAMFGLLLVSTHLWARPFWRVYNYLSHGATVSQVRSIANCSILPKNIKSKKEIVTVNSVAENDLACMLQTEIKGLDKNKKILLFANHIDNLMFPKMLEFYGYKIRYGIMENIDSYNIDDYPVIITSKENIQFSSNIKYLDKLPVYKPIPEVSCYYGDANGDIIKYKTKNNFIYRSMCDISMRFFNKRGYYLYKAIVLDNELGKYIVLDRYDKKAEYLIYQKADN